MPPEMVQPEPHVTVARLDDTLTFMQALWRLEHALERASKRMEVTLGVTGPQRLALRLIGVAPAIGPAELAAALHLHPSTLTGILQRLEQRGLIQRVRHATDARRVSLRVTRTGARLNAPSAPGTVEQAVRTVLARVRGRDREVVVALLTSLASRLIQGAEATSARRRRVRTAFRRTAPPRHHRR